MDDDNDEADGKLALCTVVSVLRDCVEYLRRGTLVCTRHTSGKLIDFSGYSAS